MVEQTHMQDERFTIVGMDYKKHVPQKRKQTLREKLKGKPIISGIILLIIILCCVFAPYIANHDPSQFYYNHELFSTM